MHPLRLLFCRFASKQQLTSARWSFCDHSKKIKKCRGFELKTEEQALISERMETRTFFSDSLCVSVPLLLAHVLSPPDLRPPHRRRRCLRFLVAVISGGAITREMTVPPALTLCPGVPFHFLIPLLLLSSRRGTPRST